MSEHDQTCLRIITIRIILKMNKFRHCNNFEQFKNLEDLENLKNLDN